MGARFAKYQALGNDYLVCEASELGPELTPSLVQRLCDRHFGVGSDGLLVRDPDRDDVFPLRIFNPDGSSAEKSGNGLRIFARYLWDVGAVGAAPFRVATAGGGVICRVLDGGASVRVDMGRASFDSAKIPLAGPRREVLDEALDIDGRRLGYAAVSVGNPHCVVRREAVSEEEARELGPRIEHEARFPNRTNVQFLEVLDRGNLRIEIWERGAGYTLASGTSSCAAAAVAHRRGWCDPDVVVHMPGGHLDVAIAPDFAVRLTGPVAAVAEGRLAAELLRAPAGP